jgi:capsular polysaccharide biosynthesis protein
MLVEGRQYNGVRPFVRYAGHRLVGRRLMSEQTLDLKRSMQIVRRHLLAVGIVTAIGFAGGLGYAFVKPPQFSANTLVELPSNANAATQAVIAGSASVLADAARAVRPPMSVEGLRSLIDVKSITPGVLSVAAEGKTAAEAENLANAVADSYIAYVGKSVAAAKVQATVLAPATIATQGSRIVHWLVNGVLGGLAGALVGATGALAAGRRDRRLRQRDEMANAIGIPVVASLPAWRGTDARSWARLLDGYQPGAVDAWQARNALHRLGLDDVESARNADASSYSLTVLSLSADRRALGVGPQIAVLAAAEGIRTALVIGPQQDTNATATLRAACAARPRSANSSNPLMVAVADNGKLDDQPYAMLTVVVAVVNGASPEVADMIRTTVTVLAVSPGAATAEDLARVAASAGADGRQIDGIVIANPDPADTTTGRAPQLSRGRRRGQPTRVTGVPIRNQPATHRYRR